MAESEKIAEQRRLYGEPIGDLVSRIVANLGITQTRVAKVLGLSPAMMSQLASGQRIKIGNPLAVARLQALLDLADHAAGLEKVALEGRLVEITSSATTLRSGIVDQQIPARGAQESTAVAESIRRTLAVVASRREIEEAATVLADSAPGVAEFLRAYGSSDPARATAHHASIQHLLD